jgi:plastocyanin domain-containing protein
MTALRIALAIGLWLCWFGSGALAEADEGVARVESDGVQRIAIVGGEYFFKPKRIVVKANVPVEFLVSKEPGMVPHTLVINAPEAGIMLDVELGPEAKPVRFTPTAPGMFPYYCKNRLFFFKSHREHGMEGLLEVRE